ncbi:MAG: polyprenyl synthetase family protein [Clostridia bacterium]|nr:polyprenyl synthetase family protein [Clostridia bacterium]
MDISSLMKENAAALMPALEENLKTPDESLETLYSAMRYSALSGGKRIRPYLVNRFCRLFGGDEKAAIPFECAIEYVHASSLIHDDMPCMDNDDLRRGKPTNHVVYGEDIALLAGDALITRGYEIAATNPFVSPEIALHATKLILGNAGGEGMMGGQQIDLLAEREKPSYELLLKMHEKKTGALIRTAALLGCAAAGIIDETDERYKAADEYARGIGLAFQIIDDILDVEGDAAILGKAVHADAKEGKTTFISFMTPAKAREYARQVTENAADAIRKYPASDELVEFAYFLLKRNK